MEDVLSCFGDVIGTTRETQSDSGLYITDLEALSTLQGLVGSEDWATIEELLENARRIAILNLNTDLTSLMMRYAKQKPSFKGKIGSQKYTKYLTETGTSGIRLICAPVRHAEMLIKGVGVMFSQTGTYEVFIENNYNDEVITLEVNAVRNKPSFADFSQLDITPSVIALPLFDEVVSVVEYYIYHNNPTPFCDNKVVCSTCKGFYFNANRPRFKGYGHESWMMLGGFNSSIEDLTYLGTNQMKGLLLNVDISCRIDKLICSEELDFRRDPMAQSFAMAIQHKAGSVVLWNILRSSKLNRVLMQDPDLFREAATYYDRRYAGMVKQISNTMPLSGCMCEKGFTDAWIGSKR